MFARSDSGGPTLAVRTLRGIGDGVGIAGVSLILVSLFYLVDSARAAREIGLTYREIALAHLLAGVSIGAVAELLRPLRATSLGSAVTGVVAVGPTIIYVLHSLMRNDSLVDQLSLSAIISTIGGVLWGISLFRTVPSKKNK